MIMRLREEPPHMWRGAKCSGIAFNSKDDPFFDEEDLSDAVSFCNGVFDGTVCPIRHDCLRFALVNNEAFGCWGGTSPLVRKAIRKKWPLIRRMEANPAWRWVSEAEALAGIDVIALLQEPDLEDDDDEDF
jgi:WhiB family redox-sensing transcriptional regulator